MLDKVAGKVEGWTSVWGDIVFSPRHFFDKPNSNPQISPFEFFTGSLILSYALTFLVSALYFLMFHRNVIAQKLGPHIDKHLTLVSELFIAYLMTFLIGFIIAAAIAFLVAKAVHSKAKFSQHFGMFLHLSALEPAAAMASTIMFLSDQKGWWLAGLIFLLTRIWALNAGYWGIQRVHRSSRSSEFVYLVGFLPSWIMLTTAIAALMWKMLSWGIVPWWD